MHFVGFIDDKLFLSPFFYIIYKYSTVYLYNYIIEENSKRREVP